MALQFIVTETITHTITVDAETIEDGKRLVDRVLEGLTAVPETLKHLVTWPERDVKEVKVINTYTA